MVKKTKGSKNHKPKQNKTQRQVICSTSVYYVGYQDEITAKEKSNKGSCLNAWVEKGSKWKEATWTGTKTGIKS